jgi:TonB-dependent Receptor Plug Domain
MKSFFLICISLFIIPFSWSQKIEKIFLAYSKTPLNKVLAEVEVKFDIKYSYVDSIISVQEITILPKKYALEEIHTEIEKQTSLQFVRIDQRYFSIVKTPQEPIKEEQLKEILVEGFLSKGINKVDQNILLYPQKVEMLPGVTDADILLSLQQLPGVKSPNETSSGLYIRGGTSDQNLILWDGIRMYHPGHLFGMISGFNPNVAQTVVYQNKATNPKYGERIASVIDIKSSDKIENKLKVNAGINGLNADVFLQTPLVKNKLGFQVSGRKSYTEWWQSPTFNALAHKVFQNTNFKDFDESNRFQFEDYTAKLNFKPSVNTEISLAGIWIGNNLDFSTLTLNQKEKNQKLSIVNQGFSLNWSQKYSSKFLHKVAFHYSSYQFEYIKNEIQSDTTFERFQKLNRITDSGIDCDFEWKTTDNLQIEFGYQLQGNDISHSFSSKNQDLEIDLNQKQLFVISNSGFLNLKYLISSWKLIGGIRNTTYSKLKTTLFEPRILLQKKISNSFTAQISFEKKNQIISQFRESISNDLSLENYIWIVSDNNQYPIQKAQQYTAGIIYKYQSWLVDVDTYYKTIDGITSLTFGFLNPTDAIPHQGKGFTKGVDILVQKSAPTWRAWITYTYQDSQNKFDDINENRYFPINANTRHAFNVSFYKKWKNYSMALGWFWHTGKPYSLLNENNQINSFNTGQLPSYHRMDISGMYHFHNQKSWSGKVGVSIYNAYNQKTIISKEYERQYTSIAEIVNTNFKVQNYTSLGIMPNVFLRVSF